MRILNSAVMMIGLSLVFAQSTAAQVTQRSKDDARKACDKAADIIEKGDPKHKEVQALRDLLQCGSGGATTTARALADSRTEQDRMALGDFYAVANQWRDADVMNAAVQVARDATATVPARVFAIRHLLWLLTPGAEFNYEALVAGTIVVRSVDGERHTLPCRHGFSSDNSTVTGTLLPTDFVAQLTSVLNALFADTSVPVPVRNAAECIQW